MPKHVILFLITKTIKAIDEGTDEGIEGGKAGEFEVGEFVA